MNLRQLYPDRTTQRKLVAVWLSVAGASALTLYLYLARGGSVPLYAAFSAFSPLSLLCAIEFLFLCLGAGLLPLLMASFRDRAKRVRQLAVRNDLIALQFQHAPDDIMVVDPAGTVIFHNRRHAELWGEADSTSQPFVRAVEPLLSRLAAPEKFLHGVQELEGSRETVLDELSLKNGRVLERRGVLLAAAEGGRRGAVWYLRDVTRRVAAKRALSESEERFRGLLEAAADAMVIVNDAHQITMVNEEFESMFGFRRDEVIGRNLSMLVPARFSQHARYVREFFDAPRKRLMGRGLKLVALKKDGSEFPVEIGLSPMRTSRGVIVSAAIRDITQRQLAERRLAVAASYARTLFEANPDPLVTISLNGQIEDVNEAAVAITGSPREALIGSDFAAHFTDREQARRVYVDAFATGFVRDYPLVLRARSGRLTEVLYNAVLYRDEAGNVAGACAAARDMTLWRLAEEELREANRTLERRVAERTESLLSRAREVLEGARVVADASGAIRQSANQAVTSALETAAALAETTAALEQVRETALVSNGKARNVSLAAQKSAEVALAGRRAVQGASQGMGRIQEQVGSSAESIIRLSQQGRAIGHLIGTVNDLAEQSNLLAVNAAIEASKAGAQGRGFAVVAREVKSLSEQSKVATAQVRSILEDIRRATDGAVLISEQGKNSAARGVEQARRVGEAIQEMEESIELSAQSALQIAASCQQQLMGLDQVTQAMESINGASGQNVTGMKRLEATLKHLEELGEKLGQLSGKLKDAS